MDRYARHTILPWFGVEGQRKLRESTALIVGCGGTGSACCTFLARAGLGNLLIIDRDVVGLTDLHRQILYREADAEELKPKAGIAGQALLGANGETGIETFPMDFRPGNAASLVERADLVVDCSDTFETRMLINDVCLKYSVPWVHGACTGTTGMVIPFPLSAGACYRCIVDHIPVGVPSPGSGPGILGPVAGTVGCLEAAEVMKILITPERVQSRMIYFDSLSYTYEVIDLRRKQACPACVGGTYEFLDGAGPRPEFVDCESGTAHVAFAGALDLERIHGQLAESFEVEDLGGALRVITSEAEFVLMKDGSAIVKGANDLRQARDFLNNLLKV